MVETHAFGNFTPQHSKYLILGSFTGRQAVQGTIHFDDTYDWFYGTKRNQFWPILEGVYGIELRNRHSKQELFSKLGIAIADIIFQCERKEDSNLERHPSINLVTLPSPSPRYAKKNKEQKIQIYKEMLPKK